jgi:indolepyruvate ferredoxin oxidoreductase
MEQDRIVSLERIYNAQRGTTFMTGIQALVRLPLMQRRLDRHRGYNTAGLVSGYRGSTINNCGRRKHIWTRMMWSSSPD